MKYVAIARPKGWANNWDYGAAPSQPTVTVFDREQQPQETGLLDANGTKLFRVEDREPIGFRPKP